MSNGNGTGPAAGSGPEAWRRWLPRIYWSYAIGVGLCLIGAFTESFANLIGYFRHNGLPLGLAIVAPSMIDIFTIGGEGLVLLATIEHWDWRAKTAGWAATAAGLAVSVAGNVGRDGWTLPGTRRLIPPEHIVTYAIPPLALAGLLALGLMIVKRALKPPTPAYLALPEPLVAGLVHFPGALNGAGVPGVDVIKRTVGCGQPRAQAIRDYLAGAREDLTRFGGERDTTETAA
jgi:hypothetical protein